MQPMLVVARGQIMRGVHALNSVADLVNVELPAGKGRDHQGKDPSLPVMMKHGFMVFSDNWPHPVHTAHIMDAVHPPSPLAAYGACTLVTPIMASRVTSAANCSSLMPSVPRGRSGSTI